MRKLVIAISLALATLLTGPLLAIATGEASLEGDWRNANHDPVGLAPEPALHSQAVVQIYAARAFSWRGAFGVHTWFALKPQGATHYQVLEVIGWRARWGGSVVSENQRIPDSRWYGADPRVILDLRGARAEKLIERIRQAARKYPYQHQYSVWPGPNSNTFTAWVGRQVPALELNLPMSAIGSGFASRPQPSQE